MGAEGSGKSRPAVLQSLFLVTSLYVVFASLQLCGGFIGGGIAVQSLRCLFLIVKGEFIETLAIFIRLRALHLFVSLSPCSSFCIYLFGLLESSIHLIGLRAAFLFVGCLKKIFGLRSTSWASCQIVELWFQLEVLRRAFGVKLEGLFDLRDRSAFWTYSWKAFVVRSLRRPSFGLSGTTRLCFCVI